MGILCTDASEQGQNNTYIFRVKTSVLKGVTSSDKIADWYRKFD